MDINTRGMKNIIVLKDLPSNIVDEAIVILKDKNKIKIGEDVNRDKKFLAPSNENSDIAIKEAEFLIKDYIEKIENDRKNKTNIRNLNIRNKKLELCSILLAITSVIMILFNIIK